MLITILSILCMGGAAGAVPDEGGGCQAKTLKLYAGYGRCLAKLDAGPMKSIAADVIAYRLDGSWGNPTRTGVCPTEASEGQDDGLCFFLLSGCSDRESEGSVSVILIITNVRRSNCLSSNPDYELTANSKIIYQLGALDPLNENVTGKVNRGRVFGRLDDALNAASPEVFFVTDLESSSMGYDYVDAE